MAFGRHVGEVPSAHEPSWRFQGSLLKVDVQGEIRLKSFLPSGSGEQPAGWTRVAFGTGSLVMCVVFFGSFF